MIGAILCYQATGPVLITRLVATRSVRFCLWWCGKLKLLSFRVLQVSSLCLCCLPVAGTWRIRPVWHVWFEPELFQGLFPHGGLSGICLSVLLCHTQAKSSLTTYCKVTNFSTVLNFVLSYFWKKFNTRWKFIFVLRSLNFNVNLFWGPWKYEN